MKLLPALAFCLAVASAQFYGGYGGYQQPRRVGVYGGAYGAFAAYAAPAPVSYPAAPLGAYGVPAPISAYYSGTGTVGGLRALGGLGSELQPGGTCPAESQLDKTMTVTC